VLSLYSGLVGAFIIDVKKMNLMTGIFFNFRVVFRKTLLQINDQNAYYKFSQCGVAERWMVNC